MIIVRDFNDPDVTPPFGFGGDEDWIITADNNDPAECSTAIEIAETLAVCDWTDEVHGDTYVIVTCHA